MFRYVNTLIQYYVIFTSLKCQFSEEKLFVLRLNFPVNNFSVMSGLTIYLFFVLNIDCVCMLELPQFLLNFLCYRENIRPE